MNADVLLNLLNELKRDKMLGYVAHFIAFWQQA